MPDKVSLLAFLEEVREHLKDKELDVISYNDLFIYASRYVTHGEDLAFRDGQIVDLITTGLFSLKNEGWRVEESETSGTLSYFFQRRKKNVE